MVCIVLVLAKVRSDRIVVSVLPSGKMSMVQVLTLVPMLVDFDMCISHSYLGFRRSSLSSVFLLAISSSLVNSRIKQRKWGEIYVEGKQTVRGWWSKTPEVQEMLTSLAFFGCVFVTVKPSSYQKNAKHNVHAHPGAAAQGCPPGCTSLTLKCDGLARYALGNILKAS